MCTLITYRNYGLSESHVWTLFKSQNNRLRDFCYAFGEIRTLNPIRNRVLSATRFPNFATKAKCLISDLHRVPFVYKTNALTWWANEAHYSNINATVCTKIVIVLNK